MGDICWFVELPGTAYRNTVWGLQRVSNVPFLWRVHRGNEMPVFSFLSPCCGDVMDGSYATDESFCQACSQASPAAHGTPNFYVGSEDGRLLPSLRDSIEYWLDRTWGLDGLEIELALATLMSLSLPPPEAIRPLSLVATAPHPARVKLRFLAKP